MIIDEKNNIAYVRGIVQTTPEFSHKVLTENFYKFTVLSQRLSGQMDEIPITISENLMTGLDFSTGKERTYLGHFRTYNKEVEGKTIFIYTLLVGKLLANDESYSSNIVMLNGFVCKAPIYRKTPADREIAEILLAVNRTFHKSDYLQCIAWGRNASLAKCLKVGDALAIIGRIQSRRYVKKLACEEVEERITYEISINKLAMSNYLANLQNEHQTFLKNLNS